MPLLMVTADAAISRALPRRKCLPLPATKIRHTYTIPTQPRRAAEHRRVNAARRRLAATLRWPRRQLPRRRSPTRHAGLVASRLRASR